MLSPKSQTGFSSMFLITVCNNVANKCTYSFKRPVFFYYSLAFVFRSRIVQLYWWIRLSAWRTTVCFPVAIFFKSHQYVKVEISRKLCQYFFSSVLMTQFQLVDHAASLKFHCFHSDWASFQVLIKHMLVCFVAVCMAGKHFLPASVDFSFCWCLRKFNIFISTSFLFKFLMLYPKKPLPNPKSWILIPMFSSINVMILAFILGYQLIF